MAEPGQPTSARRRPARALFLTMGLAVLYATGVGDRPDGAAWDRAYDVVLYNLPYLAAAWACFAAARRVRTERIAWAALGVSLTLGAIGNALRVLSAGCRATNHRPRCPPRSPSPATSSSMCTSSG